MPTFQMMITLSPPAQNGQTSSPALLLPLPPLPAPIYGRDPSLAPQTCTEQDIPGSGVQERMPTRLEWPSVMP